MMACTFVYSDRFHRLSTSAENQQTELEGELSQYRRNGTENKYCVEPSSTLLRSARQHLSH